MTTLLVETSVKLKVKCALAEFAGTLVDFMVASHRRIDSAKEPPSAHAFSAVKIPIIAKIA